MRSAWITLAVPALAIGTVAVAVSARGGDDEEVKFADCPAAVRKTLREESKGAVIETVTKETEDGETTYRADVMIGGKTYGIVVAEDGTLREISLQPDDDEPNFADCPAAVQKTFRDEAKGAQIGTVEAETQHGVTVYSTDVVIGGKTYEIKVAADGTLTEKTLQLTEDDIKLADCPAAVQKALRAEARGGDVGEITRVSGLAAKRVFLTEVKIDGKTYEVEVDEDGTLLSKSLADE
jgi:hypothetical protein